jgi:hypothetical protein
MGGIMEELFMKWRPDFELGIPEIDNQHKKIVELINSLNEAFMKDETKSKLGEVLTTPSIILKLKKSFSLGVIFLLQKNIFWHIRNSGEKSRTISPSMMPGNRLLLGFLFS